MALTARSFAPVSFLGRIRPWFEARIWKKSIIAASSHLWIRRRELGLYRSHSSNEMITQVAIIDKFDFLSAFLVVVQRNNYSSVIFCHFFYYLSVVLRFPYDTNCHASNWKNIYVKSHYLLGSHIEVELHFRRFCFSDDSIIIGCLGTHTKYLTDLVCGDIRVIKKKTSSLFVGRRKQSSGINNARKHSTRDRGRFEIRSPVIISSRLPFLGVCVLMGLSRNHRYGITYNWGYCLRIRTLTIVACSHKLIFSSRNSSMRVFSL